jgi:RNA ligase
MATRGSFTSDQAVKGMEMLSNYDYNKLHKDYTYLFEIIYPENRIVCSYDFEDVVLLGVINTEHGYEVDLHGELDMRIQNLVKNIGLNIVKRYNGISDYSVLKQMVRDDAEGFVVRFSNGDRMKVKGAEYIRLHKIMTGLSTTSVWECLSKGDDLLTIIKDVPDEFYNKVSSYSEELITSYNNIKTKCLGLYSEYRYGNEDLEPTRREYVDFVLTHPKELQGVLFNMWDGKTYDHIIWKQLKPEFMKL